MDKIRMVGRRDRIVNLAIASSGAAVDNRLVKIVDFRISLRYRQTKCLLRKGRPNGARHLLFRYVLHFIHCDKSYDRSEWWKYQRSPDRELTAPDDKCFVRQAARDGHIRQGNLATSWSI